MARLRAPRGAARAGGVLISNEIYMEFLPANRRVRAHRLAPNVVSIGSLTKAYGLGPLRVGWIVLGDDLAGARERFEDAIFLDYVDPPTSTLRWAVRAFERLPELWAAIERIERESKPAFARWLAESRNVVGQVPDYGLIAFPKVVDVADTHALARYLVDEHDVGVVAGEFFGLAGHVRVSFGLPPERLDEALARLERGLAGFRAPT